MSAYEDFRSRMTQMVGDKYKELTSQGMEPTNALREAYTYQLRYVLDIMQCNIINHLPVYTGLTDDASEPP